MKARRLDRLGYEFYRDVRGIVQTGFIPDDETRVRVNSHHGGPASGYLPGMCPQCGDTLGRNPNCVTCQVARMDWGVK